MLPARAAQMKTLPVPVLVAGCAASVAKFMQSAVPNNWSVLSSERRKWLFGYVLVNT